MNEAYDLLVIGGGINGAGIARDAAGRGLRVLLVEKNDLASHTSSASTKLVHGGLRYLENYEFRLVAESLREREVLLRNAPHIIWPLRFVMPHEPSMRPKWMLWLGLALYDRIGGRMSLPKSKRVKLRVAPHRTILQDRLTSGFEYSDCWVEDARLVVLTARDAEERGAEICVRTECTALERSADGWSATLRSAAGERSVTARAVINAAGPFVDRVAKIALGAGTPAHLRLVKGSHIIVSRRFSGEHAYIFQQPDGRIIFAIPYERDYTLIGTTDLLYEGDLDAVTIAPEETRYLCEAASRYFTSAVTEEEIVSSYAGVRPLYEDDAASNSTVTRDYVFELDAQDGAPILSVYGGKITTYRKLAEATLAKLRGEFPVMGGDWTAGVAMPGGDFPVDGVEDLIDGLRADFPFLDARWAKRLIRAYGTEAREILGDAESADDLGRDFGASLSEAELRWLMAREYAVTAEDVVWRRSKLGLRLSEGQIAEIDSFMRSA